VFTVPGGRRPSGPLAHASVAERARFDRSRTGDPVV